MDATAHLNDARGDDFCYLTTRGRRTGTPHEIEIWFAAAGTTIWMLSGGAERADWVRNLRTEPLVTVRIRDVTYDATARVEAPDTDADRQARSLLFAKYQPRTTGSLEQWRDTALVVTVTVTTSPGLDR